MSVITYLHDMFWGETMSRRNIQLVPLAPFSIMFSQGSPNEPRTCSGRIILIFFLGLGVIINAAFSADLIKTLTVKKIKMPFNDIESLYYKSNYKVLLFKGSAVLANFRAAIGASQLLINDDRLQLEDFSILNTLAKTLSQGKLAIIENEPYVQSFIDNTCDFQIIKYAKTQVPLYTWKGYPYLSLINYQ